MRFFKLLLLPVAAACVLCLGTNAHATLLAPGGSVSVPLDSASGPILANTGVIAFTTSTGDTGTYQELVLRDAGNSSGLGGLSFAYQIVMTSGELGRITGSKFGGFLTDVIQGFGASPPFATAGDTPASSATRSNNGDNVSFNYQPNVDAPHSTYVAVIRTNSAIFGAGKIALQDGGNVTVNGYAPGPEPTSIVLFAGAFVGLGVFSLRRRMKARAA